MHIKIPLTYLAGLRFTFIKLWLSWICVKLNCNDDMAYRSQGHTVTARLDAPHFHGVDDQVNMTKINFGFSFLFLFLLLSKTKRSYLYNRT